MEGGVDDAARLAVMTGAVANVHDVLEAAIIIGEPLEKLADGKGLDAGRLLAGHGLDLHDPNLSNAHTCVKGIYPQQTILNKFSKE